MDELLQHELLGFTQPESLNVWPLRRGRLQLRHHAHAGHLQRRDQYQLALRGVGIACLSDFMVRDELADGRLVKVMEHAYTDYLQPLNAVYYRNTQLSRRIACFLDFIAARM